jgi:hypothetical protein
LPEQSQTDGVPKAGSKPFNNPSPAIYSSPIAWISTAGTDSNHQVQFIPASYLLILLPMNYTVIDRD